MIRGVNKQIVEILNTENDYFEKAILFVKPEKTDLSEKRLTKEANLYVRKIRETKIRKKKKNQLILQIAKILGFMATGGAIAACIFR